MNIIILIPRDLKICIIIWAKMLKQENDKVDNSDLMHNKSYRNVVQSLT